MLYDNVLLYGHGHARQVRRVRKGVGIYYKRESKNSTGAAPVEFFWYEHLIKK